VHPRLILHRPGDCRLNPLERGFMLPVFGGVSLPWIVPDNINIATQRRGKTLMLMVPNGIPDEASPYPAVRQAQGTHDAENMPAERVCPNDVPHLASGIHGGTLEMLPRAVKGRFGSIVLKKSFISACRPI
jgi:hypothetical protein